MAQKKALIVNFSDPAEGRLRVALGYVWKPEQTLGRGGSLQGMLFALCGCWGQGQGSAGTSSQRCCQLSQATSEKGPSASTVLLPPF